MISILSSVTELERAHQLRSTVLDCYLLAIKNIANYTVELDDEISSPHRQFLEQLAADVATDQTEAEERARNANGWQLLVLLGLVSPDMNPAQIGTQVLTLHRRRQFVSPELPARNPIA